MLANILEFRGKRSCIVILNISKVKDNSSWSVHVLKCMFRTYMKTCMSNHQKSSWNSFARLRSRSAASPQSSWRWFRLIMGEMKNYYLFKLINQLQPVIEDCTIIFTKGWARLWSVSLIIHLGERISNKKVIYENIKQDSDILGSLQIYLFCELWSSSFQM